MPGVNVGLAPLFILHSLLARGAAALPLGRGVVVPRVSCISLLILAVLVLKTVGFLISGCGLLKKEQGVPKDALRWKNILRSTVTLLGRRCRDLFGLFLDEGRTLAEAFTQIRQLGAAHGTFALNFHLFHTG